MQESIFREYQHHMRHPATIDLARGAVNAAKPGLRIKRSEAALNRVVDRRWALYSRRQARLNANYLYRAAVIVRNVLYRDWDVDDVAFELSLITGDAKTFERQRARFEEKGVID